MLSAVEQVAIFVGQVAIFNETVGRRASPPVNNSEEKLWGNGRPSPFTGNMAIFDGRDARRPTSLNGLWKLPKSKPSWRLPASADFTAPRKLCGFHSLLSARVSKL